MRKKKQNMIFNFKKFATALNEGIFTNKRKDNEGLSFYDRNRSIINRMKNDEDFILSSELSKNSINVIYDSLDDLQKINIDIKVTIDRDITIKGEQQLRFTIEGKKRDLSFMARYSGKHNEWTFIKSRGLYFEKDSLDQIIGMIREIYDTTGESIPSSLYYELEQLFSKKESVTTTMYF
jgi:hypothetical protein